MITGAAAADAVARAKRLPALRVGLHVVLVNGRPALPAERVPDLVDERGRFSEQLTRTGFNYFFNPGARRQLAAEIRAQYAAFAATGLALDHANAHNHMHVHPTIFGLMLRVGRDYGDPPVRIPQEPLLPSWRARRTDLAGRFGNDVLLAPLFALMRARCRAASVAYNDFVFGLDDTGNMTSDVVLQLLRELPDGCSEMYFHPATQGPRARELATLLDPAFAQALADHDIQRSSFGDLRARRPSGSRGAAG